MTEKNTCGGGCGCSSENAAAAARSDQRTVRSASKTVKIEFLYLDLNVCEPCRTAENELDEALAEISGVLETAGAAVELSKIQVATYEEAEKLNFISSPTIRVNGRDISLDVRENYCASCSELSGDETFCRVWNYQGEEFSSVPKKMIVEAVLKGVYGTGLAEAAISGEQIERSRQNLKRFFAGRGPIDTQANEVAAAARAARPQKSLNGAGGCGCSSGCG